VKKTVLSLLFGGVAALALAQPAPPGTQNVVVVGAHVLKPGVATPVEIDILNPTNVAGVQARLLYDSNVFEAADPAGTENEGTEGEGSVITGALVTVNYETSDAPDANGLKGVNFAIAGVKGTSKTGRLLRIYFRPKAGAATNASTSFTLDPNRDFVIASADSSSGALTGSVRPGSMIVGSATAGWGVTIPQGISGSVAASEGQVWVAGDDNLLHAYDAATGAPLSGFTGPDLGGTVSGRPVIKEGAVYAATTNGKVHSINPSTGAANTPAVDLTAGSTTFSILSTPAVANGLVYVTDNADTIRALDATSLAAKFGPVPISSGQATGQGVSSPAAFGPATGTTVWVGGADNALHQYNGADLTPLKTVATGGRVQSSPFIDAAGIGFVGSEDGNVYVFNAGTGDTVGNYNTGSPVQNSPFGIGGGQVVVVNNQGQLHVVTATLPSSVSGSNPGNLKFSGGAGSNASPIVVGTSVWVGDTNGVLHNSDTSGTATSVKDIKIGGSSLTSASVPAAGTVVIASQDGSVVSIPTQ